MSEAWNRRGGAKVLIHGVNDAGTIYPFKGSRMGDSDYLAHDVFIQDQHTPAMLAFFHQEIQTDLSFAVDPSPGDWTITLNAGHGFTAPGEKIEILEGAGVQYCEVVNVAGNVLTLDEMVLGDFSLAANIHRVTDSLKVNGAVTRQTFFTYPPPGVDYDVTGIRLNMTTTAAPDDSVFGDITALLRGVNFHVLVAEGVPFSLGSVHTNGDLALLTGSVEYFTKAGGGAHSVRAVGRIKNDWGVTLRLRGTVSGGVYTRDEMRLVVQDDLTSLISISALIYGHIVSN